MTISDRIENLLPVLSLDVYARGYGNDMKDFRDDAESGDGIVVAGANLLFSSRIYGPADDAISFYAAAYEFEGKVIISFRGTDNPALDWRAWLEGGGVTSDQSLMALRFYNDVLQATGKTAADIITTGHSLGGGLAGLVARIHGLDSVVYDSMAFDLAAQNTRDLALSGGPGSELYELMYGQGPVTPIGGHVEQIYVNGELMEFNRLLTSYDAETSLALGKDAIILDDVALNPFDRHSQTLLVVRNYLSTAEWSANPEYAAAGKYIYPALFDDEVARTAGVDLSDGNDGASLSYIMGIKLSYTVAAAKNGDPGLYGSSAIKALYDDMKALGGAELEGGLSFGEEIGDAIVRYSAILAENSVSGQHEDGFLTYSAENRILGATFSMGTWEYGFHEKGREIFLDELGERTGVNVASALSRAYGSGAINDLVQFFFVLGDEAYNGSITADNDALLVAWVGTSFGDTITGSEGNEIFFGGSANPNLLDHLFGWGGDTIDGGAGRDLIFGSDWHDTLTGGAGVDFIYAGKGDDTVKWSQDADWIDMGEGDDYLEGAAVGSIITTGEGEDTVSFSRGVQVLDADEHDRVTFFGIDLELAITWKASESEWAYGLFGFVKVGFNTDGEMVVGLAWDDDTEDYMYLANANNDPLAPSAELTAGVRVAVLHIAAHPLIYFIRNNLSIDQSSWWQFWGLAIKEMSTSARVAGSDPLVLDLDGDGIELTGLNTGRGPRFDTDGDLFAEYTGWVKGDDGMLALDANGNGIVDDGSELFGNATMSGFAELATHDANADGVINSADAVFANLRVWRDLDQDGKTDAGEMFTLDQLGIASINLTSTATNTISAGNTITGTGSFTRGNGTTGAVADVELHINNVDTQYTGDRSVLAGVAASMPNIKGKGTLVDLHVAISRQGIDGALAQAIAAALPTLDTPDLGVLTDRAKAIIDAWVAASPGSNGTPSSDVAVLATLNGSGYRVQNFAISVTEIIAGQTHTYWKMANGALVKDANGIVIARPTLQQVLDQVVPAGNTATWQVIDGSTIDFLERYFGEQLPLDSVEALNPQAASALSELLNTYVEVSEKLALRLALQGPLEDYFAGIRYDAAADKFQANTGAGLAPMFTAIFNGAPEGAAPAQAWLEDWMPLVNAMLKDFVRNQSHLSVNNPYLLTSIISGFEQSQIDVGLDFVTAAFGVSAGTLKNATGTYTGGIGNDIIYLAAANTTARGGNGADNYIVGGTIGNSVIEDIDSRGRAYDTLRFARHTVDDLTFNRVGRDVVITVNATGETLTIKNQYYDRIVTLWGSEVGPDYGITEIVFADGRVWTKANLMRAVSHADPAAAQVLGTDHGDYIDGGAGNDFLSGKSGGDFYIFGRGYGVDTLHDRGANIFIEAPDILQFGPGITESDLIFSRNSNSGTISIRIAGSDDVLTISDQFTATYTGVFGAVFLDRIESFVFENGQTLTAAQVAAKIIRSQQTDGNDAVYGYDLEDRLDGGKGDDFLHGGNENDVYVFGTGYGHDTIRDNQSNILGGQFDRIEFKAGIRPEDIQFERIGGSQNLKLILPGGETLTILDQFAAVYTGVFGTQWFNRIEQFVFKVDGQTVTMNWAEIRQRTIASQTTTGDDAIYGFSTADTLDGGAGNDLLSGGNENDTYLFGYGSGNDTIKDGMTNILSNNSDTVRFGAGVTSSNVTFSRVGNSNNLIVTLDSGETLTIQGQFSAVYTVVFGTRYFDRIEYFVFTENGETVTLNSAQVENRLLEQAKTTGDDTIYGFSGDDRLDGGAGNDYLAGGDDNDTYVFGFGYGNDTIYDRQQHVLSGTYDRVIFKAPVGLSDVRFSHIGSTDDLLITLSDGSTLTILDMFGAGNGNGNIEEFFFEGPDAFLYKRDIARLSLEGAKTSGNDTIHGFDNSGDHMDGGAGNDYLAGSAGNDSYHFGRGSGHDTVYDASGSWDRVVFGAGITQNDIIVSRGPGLNDVKLVIADTGETLTITLQNNRLLIGSPYNQIELFEFADGSSWTGGDVRSRLLVHEATAGNDVINGFWSGDYMDGGAGNDTLIGRGGGDVYRFGIGSGQDIVHAGAQEFMWSDSDRVDFGPGITRNDIAFSRAGNNLVVSIIGTTDTLTIVDHFIGGKEINAFKFADGTIMTEAEAQAIVMTGSSAGETIHGLSNSDDVLIGNGGNDTLIGYSGSDTYRYKLGDGHEVITEGEYNADTDRIAFGVGIAPTGLVLTRTGTSLNDLLITLPDGGTLTIAGQFLGNGRGVEAFTFADGTTWTRDMIRAAAGATENAVIGTTAAETLTGTTGDDVFATGGGGDTLVGRAGWDRYVYDGSGDVSVDENGAYGDHDVLDLTAFDRSQVALSRVGNNLVATVTATGAKLTVLDHFRNGADGIESIRFSNQTLSWFDIGVATAAGGTAGNDNYGGTSVIDFFYGGAGDDRVGGGAGGDVFVMELGHGNDTIGDGGDWTPSTGDQLYFRGILPSEVVFTRAGRNLVLTASRTVEGVQVTSSVTIIDQFWQGYASGVERIIFDDGTSWDSDQIRARTLASQTSAGNDTIQGFFTYDTLQGGTGNDNLYGGDGSDLYLYSAGDGHDFIAEDHNSGTDTLQFLDINSDEVIFSHSGEELIITFSRPGLDGSVRLSDQMAHNYVYGVQYVRFADGVRWTQDEIIAMVIDQGGTAGNDTVYGFATTADTLIGRGGDDTLNGGGKSDTYMFGLGDGNDYIYDYYNNGDGDLLVLSDWTKEQVKVARIGDDMVLTFVDENGASVANTSIRIWSGFYGGYGAGIDLFEFGDGTTISRGDMYAYYLETAPTEGNDTFNAFGSNDIVHGNGGNDALYGHGGHDRLHGDDGDDFLDGGDGDDRMFGGAGNDRIVGGSGEDYLDGGDGVDTADYLYFNGDIDFDLGQGLIWTTDAQEIILNFENLLATNGINNIRGSFADNRLEGMAGSDNYYFGGTIGHDTVVEVAAHAGEDWVTFDTVASDQVRAERSGTAGRDLLLTVLATGETVRILNQFATATPTVEYVRFSDNVVWGIGDANAAAAYVGTGGNDTVVATSAAETLEGGAGNDVLSGEAGGDTYVYRRNEGNDLISDAGDTAETDTLRLVGITRQEVSFVRTGNDLFVQVAGTVNAIRVQDHYLGTTTGIERVVFDDGTALLASDIVTGTTYLGTSGNDAYEGTSGDDTFGVQFGADTVQGLGGSDTYIAASTGSAATIVDAGNIVGETDRLILSDLLATDLLFTRTISGDLVITSNQPGWQQTIVGQFTDATKGVEEIVFGNSAVWNRAAIIAAVSWQGAITGTSGNDTLNGTTANNVLIGGTGNDALNGGNGNDIYVFRRGDGNDVITEATNFGTTDRLVLEGIGRSAVTFRRDSNDDASLVIAESAPGAGNGGSVRLVNSFHEATNRGIEFVQFDDGTTWTRADLRTLLLDAQGTAAADTIMGFNTADTIRGRGGNDSLNGWAGDDTFIYARGDGHDVLTELENYGTADRLLLAGIDVSAVTFRRDSNDDASLIIAESTPGAGDGGSIRLVNSFHDFNNRGIEEVRFDDGTVWTRADLRARLLAQQTSVAADTIMGFNTDDTIVGGNGNDILNGWAGNDTFVYTRGDGHDTITEQVNYGTLDRLVLHGIDPSQVSLVRNTADDATLVFAASAPGAGDEGSVKLIGSLDETGNRGIEQITFDNGVIWTRADLRTKLLAAYSTAGVDMLDGFDTADTFDAGTGNDTLSGSESGDTYLYSRGDGTDIVIEGNVTGTDRVVLVDIMPGLVIITRNGSDLNLTIPPSAPGLNDGGYIVLRGQLGSGNSGVEEIIFADASVWTKQSLLGRVTHFGGTNLDEQIIGTTGADIMLASAGNDLLTLEEGSDTYVYGVGSGNDLINEKATGTDVDVLQLVGLNLADIRIERPMAYQANIDIRILSTGETITLDNQGDKEDGVEIIQFADGTTLGGGWTLDAILGSMITLTGGAGNDTVTAYTNSNDILDGMGGNDFLRGRTGNDTYLFGRGSGSDIIDDEGGTEAGSADRVLFGANIAPGDIEFSRVGADILARIVGTTDTLTVKDGLWALINNSTNTLDRIEFFDFADGTRLTLSQVQVLAWARGGAGNDTLAGVSWGETLHGAAGNDTMAGAAGDDTYIYRRGDGDDIIDELTTGGTGDRLTVEGINLASQATWSIDGNDLLITIAATAPGNGGSIRIKNQMLTTGQHGVETIADSIGNSWSKAAVAGYVNGTAARVLWGDWQADTLIGGSNADALHGGDGDDILIGGAGADTLNGGDGFDIVSYATASAGIYLHSGVPGDNAGDSAGDVATGVEGLRGSAFDDELIIVDDGATVWGGAGHDLITMIGLGTTAHGEDGNDTIYGGAGADIFHGGNGNDEVFGYEGNDQLILGAGDDYALGGDGDDLIEGGDNDDVMHGHEGSDTLLGQAGSDVLHGDEGDDILEGGMGDDWLVGGLGNDTFRFAAISGEDGIADFETHGGTSDGDVIELHGQTVSTFAALMANAVEWDGTTSCINLDNGQNITLHGVTLDQLSASDFRFM